MEYSSAITFINQFAAGDYTESEHRDFVSWLNSASQDEVDRVMEAAMSMGLSGSGMAVDAGLVRRIEAGLDEYEQSLQYPDEPEESKTPQHLPTGSRQPGILARIASVAALVLLLAGAGWWLAARHHKDIPTQTAQEKPRPDIAPGRNAAILSLSGGRRVLLDSAAEDTVLSEGAAIVANAHGRLAYNPGSAAPAETIYNTLTTQRGNQYQLTLPDGTRVWLNAASSITFPTVFGGDSRTVSITGEAYFEIAPKPSQPFHVKAAGLDIAVLGTRFNINTYPDEPASRTTLVEGRVRVTLDGASQLLRPGDQARVSEGRIRVVADADIEQALAWKNGLVKLTGASIREVMRQVSRWYDVDVEYQGDLENAVFVGVVSRQQNLAKFLEVLEATGSVHCIVDNKKITIKP
ncbi:MAG TPA: FecR domain-containing protein [Puia sp.]|uniref:FecR family protein n=1 Tax=Puia sp. TaxID=2045100 RepID=UPI002B516E0C|nr:FecR domain-containing protein [Puia sp.]HVU94344.1 FecR domain-containing protein [Puia sp.]